MPKKRFSSGAKVTLLAPDYWGINCHVVEDFGSMIKVKMLGNCGEKYKNKQVEVAQSELIPGHYNMGCGNKTKSKNSQDKKASSNGSSKTKSTYKDNRSSNKENIPPPPVAAAAARQVSLRKDPPRAAKKSFRPDVIKAGSYVEIMVGTWRGRRGVVRKKLSQDEVIVQFRDKATYRSSVKDLIAINIAQARTKASAPKPSGDNSQIDPKKKAQNKKRKSQDSQQSVSSQKKKRAKTVPRDDDNDNELSVLDQVSQKKMPAKNSSERHRRHSSSSDDDDHDDIISLAPPRRQEHKSSSASYRVIQDDDEDDEVLEDNHEPDDDDQVNGIVSDDDDDDDVPDSSAIADTFALPSQIDNVILNQLHSINGIPIKAIQLDGDAGNRKENRGRNFAERIFGKRIITVEVMISWAKDRSKELKFHSFKHAGVTYELLASKLHRDRDHRGFRQKFRVTLCFVAVRGKGITEMNLRKRLNAIGNFASLTPGKRASRLELFLTPAAINKNNKTYMAEGLHAERDFELIEENCHEGCGFIPRAYLERFLGTNTVGKRSMAIQVRIFCPRLGIFKGMLMEKRTITKIQLPPSMRKVGPSRCLDPSSQAIVVIKGIFPSDTCRHMQKVLLRQDLPKAFQPKPVSPMILRLWETLGVDQSFIDGYKRQILEIPKTCEHCFVVGVADPTDAIPEGHIFVPGLPAEKALYESLLVIRCPAMDPNDAIMLPLVTEKPAVMEQADWDFLNKMAFGTVIFGNSNEGNLPLPNHISNGDNDGDLYCLCWSPMVLHDLQQIEDLTIRERPPEKKEAPREREKEWLRPAQELAGNINRIIELNVLISKLYSISEAKAIESDCKAFNEEARAFGLAYQKALDLQKHGGTVPLPKRYWTELNECFHKYCHDVPERQGR